MSSDDRTAKRELLVYNEALLYQKEATIHNRDALLERYTDNPRAATGTNSILHPCYYKEKHHEKSKDRK